MPYLRFTRDTRGFEHTYLVHAFRIRGRSQPRVLYWFRTPPGVRVGRSPLDEEAIRTIEESNPELKFDWKRILQARPEPPVTDLRRRGDAPRRNQRPRGSGSSRPRQQVQQQPRRAETRPIEVPEPVEVSSPDEKSEKGEKVEEQLVESSSPLDGARAALSENRSVATPLGVEADLGEDAGEDADLEQPEIEAKAVARPARALDPESHARLRARYAEILARISERTADPARQEELRAKAGRLDPDAWVTADEVRQGLEHYEQIYAELRGALGRRRRRHRGRRRSGPAGTETPPAAG